MKIEDLNLSALRYFIDAVELKSISQSALKNSVSRPAVSQAILRLGEWYGKRLLVHEKRNFELTRDGRDFYQRAKKSMAALELAILTKTDEVNTLKIGCSHSLMDLVLPQIDFAIKEASDPIVLIGKTDQLLNDLKEKKINMAFAIDHGKAASFKKSEFKSGEFVCLSRSGKFESRLITTETRPEVDSFLKYALKKRMRIESHIVVESWSVAIKLAQHNLGGCLVPDYMVSPPLKRIFLPQWRANYSAVLITSESVSLSSVEEKVLRKLS
jgi:DNA-binding transcriptional LysR family regulator